MVKTYNFKLFIESLQPTISTVGVRSKIDDKSIGDTLNEDSQAIRAPPPRVADFPKLRSQRKIL